MNASGGTAIWFVPAVLLLFAGCGGESRVERPPVIMETLTDVTARDPYQGVQGKGYAHVCPGADTGNKSRSFLIVVNGFSYSAVDRQPAEGELESFCGAHADDANYHRIMTRWSTGADYIQRNAGFIRSLIELAIEKYAIDDNDKVAVVGYSMGGVVSRYALQSMESEGVPHMVDLYVSVDAPQQGAYIPIGAQYLAAVYKDDGAGGLLEELNSHAARQMLIYHYSRGESEQTFTDSYRSLYIDELQGALGGFLRTDGLRTVAVSSGRADGILEQPAAGVRYFGGHIQRSGSRSITVAAGSPCPENMTFDVTVDVYIVAQAWSLQPGASPGRPVRVASSRVDSDVNGIDIDNRNKLEDHFKAAAKEQGNFLCDAFITDGLVGRIVDKAVSEGRRQAADKVEKYDHKDFYVRGSAQISEGFPGGLGGVIGQLRQQMTAAGFSTYAADPAVLGKDTNMFVPVASALLLAGVNPTDNLPIETLEAASPFDKIYVEASTNLGHLATTSNWFGMEVSALFDAETVR